MKVWVITELNREDDDGNFGEIVIGVAGTEAARDRMTQQDATWPGWGFKTDSWRCRTAEECEVQE